MQEALMRSSDRAYLANVHWINQQLAVAAKETKRLRKVLLRITGKHQSLVSALVELLHNRGLATPQIIIMGKHKYLEVRLMTSEEKERYDSRSTGDRGATDAEQDQRAAE